MKRYRCCILANCCVPWDEQHQFAESVFRNHVRRLIAHGIRDLYIFGTAGEGYAVSDAQFDRIVPAFLEETRAREIHGMVGVISLSLATVIERIERAHAMGARRFQVSLPSWGALNDAELETFFRETCGRFPDCEFLHYNLLRAQRLVTPAEYARLAERHPNLVATKNSTPDIGRLRGLLAKAPQLQHFFTEPGFAYGSLLGECGLLISLASLNLSAGQDYFRAGRARDTSRLLELHEELLQIGEHLKRIVGTAAHMDGAYDKCFCRLYDPAFPLRLLPPYACASDDAFEQFRHLLREEYPRWALVSDYSSSGEPA
jgi:dihydrodipicolinate synthase/N-acetylneuraminate lyase